MTIPKPDPRISWGNIINLGALVAAVGLGWGIMSERGEQTSGQLNDLRATLRLEAKNRTESQIALELRIRALENSQTRTDERFISILGILERSDGRLQRIEKKLEGVAR